MTVNSGPTGRPERSGSGRLSRSRTDRKIAGVCGGFAAYAGLDANLVRLAMVLLVIFGGSGALLYLVAWILVPQDGAGGAS
jgi:phage shock protein C